MAEQDNKQIGRRQFIRLAGVSVVTTSIAGLAACSGGDSGSSAPAPTAPAPKADPAPPPKAAAPQPGAPEPVATQPAPAPAVEPGDMPKVSESDPVASSLGYKHNAAEVDLSKHPKRGEAAAADQYCKNCVLFQGKDGDEWGGCSIFGGKMVNANG